MQHDELLDRRDQTDPVGQQVDAAVASLGPVTGTDSSGTVSVTLDVDGVLDRVRVGVHWVDAMAPADLSAAVLAALTEAGVRRTAAQGQRLVDEQDQPTPPATRPLPRGEHSARLSDAAGDGIDQQAMAEVLSMMSSLEELMADLDARLEAAAGAEHTARSGAGHVLARCHVSGDIIQLDFDQCWLKRSHAVNIGRETTDACRRAFLTATEKGLDAVVAESKRARLQGLLQDAEAFARTLRETPRLTPLLPDH